MAIHIELVEHHHTKYKAPDYGFVDKNTKQPIGYGAYNKRGDFEVMGLAGGVEVFVCAARAYVELNNRLVDYYGY